MWDTGKPLSSPLRTALLRLRASWPFWLRDTSMVIRFGSSSHFIIKVLLSLRLGESGGSGLVVVNDAEQKRRPGR